MSNAKIKYKVQFLTKHTDILRCDDPLPDLSKFKKLVEIHGEVTDETVLSEYVEKLCIVKLSVTSHFIVPANISIVEIFDISILSKLIFSSLVKFIIHDYVCIEDLIQHIPKDLKELTFYLHPRDDNNPSSLLLLSNFTNLQVLIIRRASNINLSYIRLMNLCYLEFKTDGHINIEGIAYIFLHKFIINSCTMNLNITLKSDNVELYGAVTAESYVDLQNITTHFLCNNHSDNAICTYYNDLEKIIHGIENLEHIKLGHCKFSNNVAELIEEDV